MEAVDAYTRKKFLWTLRFDLGEPVTNESLLWPTGMLPWFIAMAFHLPERADDPAHWQSEASARL